MRLRRRKKCKKKKNRQNLRPTKVFIIMIILSLIIPYYTKLESLNKQLCWIKVGCQECMHGIFDCLDDYIDHVHVKLVSVQLENQQ